MGYYYDSDDDLDCGTCGESFYYRDELEEHRREHWVECETCTRRFPTHRAREQHMDALDHHAQRFECETCTRDFPSERAAEQHMSAVGHWAPRFPCETCSMKFHSSQVAAQHMEDQGHYENYCSDCNRRFDNPNNLRTHLNSHIHRGRNIACPFCKVGRTTASGLSHHLESGSCPSAPRLNRETILQMVREQDRNGLITKKQIGWHDEASECFATGQSWNGGAFECYMCHREFNTIQALNQHLNSPAHKQKVYICPNRRSCIKEFVTLAALFNHLESESCAFMRFEKVQKTVGAVLIGGRMIGFG